MAKKLLLSLAALAAIATTQAADFVDSGMPDELITTGVRVGVTSSNLSTDIPGYDDNCNFSWKAGFEMGVIMNLNVRDFFSIQPGFFFETRRYSYVLIDHNAEERSLQNQFGSTRRSAFTIPVMLSFHFNISNAIRWTAEIGPYFTFGTGSGKDEINQVYISAPETGSGTYISNTTKQDYYGHDEWQHRTFDCGVKCGTEFQIMGHYVVGVHYQHGLRNVSANHALNWEMHNRGWSFTVGYDF